MRRFVAPARNGALGFIVMLLSLLLACTADARAIKRSASSGRERTSINSDWKFARFTENPDGLSYNATLRPYLLPSATNFVLNGTKYTRPSTPLPSVEYAEASFDDGDWEAVNLPHDWAIKGPFGAPGIGSGMGRLPSNGIGWYRRTVAFSEDDLGKSVFLDVDGAMSHAAVWLNGQIVGGWPYGYASFRLDLTPYLKAGEDNILAIRLENELDSSRWYPGGGIYRNVWLVKVDKVHVDQYGTFITTPAVSSDSATVQLSVTVRNTGNYTSEVGVETEVYSGDTLAMTFPSSTVTVSAGATASVNNSAVIANPELWGPPPKQTPNIYKAVTTLTASNGTVIDSYETEFGIREVTYSGSDGIHVNGERVYVQGVCNHHDLGSLGAAFNYRAAERQLEMLQEMGTNALRTSHNPPAPELLELTDRLGFVVMDEAFDVWNEAKVTNDYHLLFPDWHEPDMRSFVRRDRNHPSIIAWSIGNEIPEQSTAEGAATGKELDTIQKEEDPTRPSTSALNNAVPSAPLTEVIDIEGLNYQGEGRGDSWDGSYPDFHEAYPDKVVWTTESSSVLSTRGTYIFPVVNNKSAVVDWAGGVNDSSLQVSSYELYGPSWGSSPDKVFTMQDRYAPYAAGEFVWTGWDYIGEPTPYDDDETGARSSYFGIIDMAGFKKDRFYLYQARWRSDFPMAHILPHWNWESEREGEVTPVHVFSSGDEAELFVNGESAGKISRAADEYRFRWDNVTYSPGELRVTTWKDGELWAEDTRKTVGAAAALNMTADRTSITADGYGLSFVSVAVVDDTGATVPLATNNVTFAITSGPGEIVSTDNGDPADFTAFPSLSRNAFSGYVMAVVRAKAGETGDIVIEAISDGLGTASVTVEAT
ncbi:beta-galactosidase [Xylariaceae sp. FL0016]|nr:beta-galactosidase [Xylariaceae sp. FL0016]